jgi:hypothetical protein
MFLPETHEAGVFGLYDIELNFMASVQDLTADFFIPPPPMPPPEEEVPLPPEEEPPPPVEAEPLPTQEVPAGETEPAVEGDPPLADEEPPPPPPEPGTGFDFQPAMVTPAEIVGLGLQPEFFRFVYGTEVPNENYDPSGNPFFDDVNGNGVEDPGEHTSDFRPTLFNPDDWRSTDISRYYRRASGGAVAMEDVDFESPEPRAFDGEALVARNYLPRLNAFKFGRPNSAINLLTTFMPPNFFNGTHALDEDTPLSIMQAIATINLVMEQSFNVEAVIDIDGSGPHQPERILTDAWLFVLPIGDPLVLLLDGFENLSEVPSE